MLTYIVRRILYSIPVLIALDVPQLHFHLARRRPAGEPARESRKISHETLQPARAHVPPRPVDPRPLLVLGPGRLHAQARQLAADLAADLARHHRRDRAHAADRSCSRRCIALILGVAVGIYSAIRQYSIFDYIVHVAQLPRLCDADLLARAAPPDPLRRHLSEVERADLLYLGPEQRGHEQHVVARPAAAHRAAGHHATHHQLCAVQPIHARVDARRDQQRTTCAPPARRGCRNAA